MDQEHVKKLCRETVKRQDVIYGERRHLLICCFLSVLQLLFHVSSQLHIQRSLRATVFNPFIFLYP